MRTTSLVAAAACLALVAQTGIAAAQDDASATAAARAIGTEGLRLAETGNCKDAIEKLDRAEKLRHAPTTLAKLGECQVQTGKLVVGLEALRRVVREPLAPDAPPAFQQAKQRAQTLLDANQAKVAQLHVTVSVPAGVKAEVTVDGETATAALLDVDRPTDPGAHTVEASAPGYKKATQAVTLKESERIAITLTPEIDPNAPAVTPPVVPVATSTPPPEPTQPPPPPPPQPSKTLRYATYGLFGAGGAGLVVGTIFGIGALVKKGSLHDDCPVGDAAQGENPADRYCHGTRTADDRGSVKTWATVSTVGFVVGGVGVVGGVATLLFARSEAKGQGQGKAAKFLAGLEVGPTSFGYRGSF